MGFFVTLMKETAIRFDSYEVKMDCIAGKDWIYDLIKLELFDANTGLLPSSFINHCLMMNW